MPETPPRVIATTPDTFEVRGAFSDPVRIQFERRLSERPTTGTLRDAVVVSPRAGDIEVSHEGNAIEISMDGGFRAGTVYQVTLLPRFQDRYQNRLVAPVELFFSTGPDFEQTVLGGVVLDRLTFEQVPDARLDAELEPDGPTFSTVADSTGLFAFQYLPSGRYRVTAYDDQSGNRAPDFQERQDAIEVVLGPADTLVLSDLTILEPDTTAAVLSAAEARDSLSVQVTFDDPIDPGEPLDEVVAVLEREDGAVPDVVEVLHLHEWEARQQALRGEQAPPGDPDDPDDPDEQTDEQTDAEPQTGEQELILPTDRLVLVLGSALEPGAVYSVRIEGVRNLSGIPEGGGEAEFEAPEPPAEEDPGDDVDDDGGDDGSGDGGDGGVTMAEPGRLDPSRASRVLFMRTIDRKTESNSI